LRAVEGFIAWGPARWRPPARSCSLRCGKRKAAIMALPSARPLSLAEVPVIDLGPMRSRLASERRRIAREIAAACRESGFFYIANHGIPTALVDEMFDAARRFFALPIDEKMEVSLLRSANYRGYLPMKMMGADPSIKGNLHEGFQIHLELGPDHPQVAAGKPLHGANQWPRAMPSLREKMLRYHARLHEFALELLEMFALGLDLPERIFHRFFTLPMMQYRFLHYPPQGPTDPGDHLGTRPHTDAGAFTILAQDAIGGLEILLRNGEWIRVPPIADTFVVNIGEMMKVWTDGIFASTPHRVVNRYGEERYSMPFFATPDFDAVITPIIANPARASAPEFATSVDPGKGMTCGEILLRVYTRIWPNAGVAVRAD
jgi:isopenicillin N synthase-like dioxygenase